MRSRHALAAVAVLAWSAAPPLTVQAAGTVHSPAATHASSTAITPNGTWDRYHHDDARTGFDSTQPNATTASAGWVSAALDGSVYGEPLVYQGMVYVATLNNTVYALNQTDGSVVWSHNLGQPESTGWSCGNVSPQGIIGTGVIDAAQSRIYEVAFEKSGDSYWLFGLSLTTGAIALQQQIAPTGFDWRTQQERGALGLSTDGSHVYVPIGGRYGDCTPYYGWVIGVPTAGGAPDEQYRTPSTAESVWAAGGMVVDDSTGNVFFSTGNAIPCSGAQLSDSVVRVNATLGSPTFFQPSDWYSNWCVPDLDLGSATPVMISSSLIFTSGKYGSGFLLNPANLGGTGGQLFRADVCHGIHSDATFGSFAYAAPYVYLECNGGGLVALSVDTANHTFSQCASTCGAPSWTVGGSATFGPPIVAGNAVWAVDINGGGLYGFDAATGAQLYHSAGFGVMHFSTPSEAGGQIFVSAGTVVRSFNMQFGCRSVGLSGSPAGSAAVTTTPVFTAAASGCANPLYQFWTQAPGGSYEVAQPYSASATFSWPTTGLQPGTYNVAVWARDSASAGVFGNALGRWDAFRYVPYTLTSNACTSVTLTTLPLGPRPAGTTVTVTARAAGCPNPQYQFWTQAPGGAYQIAQQYSTNTTFSWTTNALVPGTWYLAVWARDANSSGVSGNGSGRWDAFRSAPYALTGCGAVTLTASPAGGASRGTTVNVAAQASGCAQPQYQFWTLAPGGTWQVAQPYSSTATFAWSTGSLAPGSYYVAVWARDAASGGASGNAFGRWDAFRSIPYTLS